MLRAFDVESLENIQLFSTSKLSRYLAYVNGVFEGLIGPIMVKFSLMGLSFSFDALLGFYLLF